MRGSFEKFLLEWHILSKRTKVWERWNGMRGKFELLQKHTLRRIFFFRVLDRMWWQDLIDELLGHVMMMMRACWEFINWIFQVKQRDSPSFQFIFASPIWTVEYLWVGFVLICRFCEEWMFDFNCKHQTSLTHYIFLSNFTLPSINSIQFESCTFRSH